MKNKHETERAREIAEGNTILQVQVGSGLHGVTVDNQDDRDEMGVCIEPASCVIGIEKVPVVNSLGYVNWEVFEQYLYRTQPEGARSGPGDLDLTVYSLRKWTRLAAHGNPTVLLLLFAPRTEWVSAVEPYASQLQDNSDLFLSKDCGRRFMGYLKAQKERMLGLRNQRTNRPELIDLFGFDTKFAYHAIRLGLQGIELMETGKITLPMPEPHRQWLTELRKGYYPKQDALDRIDTLSADLSRLVDNADLPDKADSLALNAWLTEVYTQWWGKLG